MKSNKQIISIIICIIIGFVLSVCSWVDLVDSYWTGMGTALLIIGILKIIRLVRYKKDESYREAVDTNNNDERNRYISMKAWSWTGYIFVLIAAVASIALKVLGYEDYSMFSGLIVCVIMVLYWISFFILRKKY